MRKMITLLIAAAFMMLSAGAWADDFKGQTQQYPKNNYSTESVNFSLSEVAATLGVEADSLAKALTGSTAEWSIAYTNAEGMEETSTQKTTSEGGFYMDCDGVVCSWKTAPQHAVAGEPNWYVNFAWDASADQLTFLVGQYSGVMQAGDDYTCHLILTLGEKTAHFYINLQVIAKPVVSTRLVSEIEVLKTVETTVSQDARNNTQADEVEVDVSDAATLLGYTDAELQKVIGFAIHTNSYDSEREVMGDTLAMPADYANPSFQLVSFMNDETGVEDPHCVHGTTSTYTKFHISSISYAEGKLRFSIYQQPGVLKSGDEVYAMLYILKDGKAYAIRVNLHITDHVVLTPDVLTTVGEQTFQYEYVTDNTEAENYLAAMSKIRYTIDMPAILAAFPEGATAEDLVFMTTQSSDNRELLDHDAIVSLGFHSSNGAYMKWDGTLCTYGDPEDAAKIGYNSGASFDFAYVPATPEDGSRLVKTVYLVYDYKYAYVFNFDITLHNTPTGPVYVAVTNPQEHLDAGKTIYTHDEATDTYTAASAVEEGVQYYVLQEDYIEPKPEYTFDTCEEVDEITFDIDLVLCESTRTLSRYRIENGEQVSDSRNVVTTFDADYLTTTLGTATPDYYVAVKGTDAAGADSIYYHQAVTSFSSASLSGNNGGAWLSKEGSYDGAWGDGYPIGFSHLGNQIEWWKNSSPGVFTEGEQNTVSFYLVNIQTGKKVKATFHITWVNSISTAEVVASEEIILGTRGEGDNEYVLDFDFSGVAEKLGTTVEELSQLATIYVKNQSNRYVAAADGDYYYDELDGVKLTADGTIISESEEDIVYTLNIDLVNSSFVTYVIDDAAANSTYTTTIYLEYDGKRYQFDIVVTPDPDNYEPSAISSVVDSKSHSAIYTISGQRINTPERGLNIIGGHKVLVK